MQRPGLGLFRGTDDLLGWFTLFERSVALDARAKAEATAGRDSDRPSWATAGEGDGGPPGLAGVAGELREERASLEVQRVTRNLWRLLSSAR